MRGIWTMVGNDLKQRIRDKSVFIFSLLVPLSLMGVLNLAFGGFGTDNVELKPATVVASNDDAGPLGGALLSALDSLEVMDVSLRSVPAAEVSRRPGTVVRTWGWPSLQASPAPSPQARLCRCR